MYSGIRVLEYRVRLLVLEYRPALPCNKKLKSIFLENSAFSFYILQWKLISLSITLIHQSNFSASSNSHITTSHMCIHQLRTDLKLRQMKSAFIHRLQNTQRKSRQCYVESCALCVNTMFPLNWVKVKTILTLKLF